MSPSDELPELAVLGIPSPMETMMLALVHPVIQVYKVRGFGQHKAGKLHVINFPQDLTEVFHIIPSLLYELLVMVLRVWDGATGNAREQQTLVRDGGRGPSVRNGPAIVQAGGVVDRGLGWPVVPWASGGIPIFKDAVKRGRLIA
ncbi:hypothetical protein L211DRAFT_533348 [Terfezia boudieri ATCC MYA-4762]|uniref:DUF6570 domain-containing protein n=1 Tax=Terfezia boudieri ATCC MYA-4762 TaxID=1051890 RepID=A0A3N4LFM9_9PEZI|nr:hypothetical protein L211DRAFT_533348 [Terfezia boudieri ATCC MYA-4762]